MTVALENHDGHEEMDTLLICPSCVDQLETTEVESMLEAPDDLCMLSELHLCFVTRLHPTGVMQQKL